MREGQEALEVFLVVLRLQLSSSSAGSVFLSNFVSSERLCFDGPAARLGTDPETTTLPFLLVSFVLPRLGVRLEPYLRSVLDLSLVTSPLVAVMFLTVTTDLVLICF